MTHINAAKQQRTKEYAAAAELKLHRAINDLSGAFLRAHSMRQLFEDERAALVEERAAGKNSVAIPIDRFEPTRATRTTTALIHSYASLYIVIEGWQNFEKAPLRITDERIEKVLASRSEFVKLLKNFRHSVFHPSELLDKRLLAFHKSQPELAVWARDLSEAFSQFFRDWRVVVGLPKDASA